MNIKEFYEKNKNTPVIYIALVLAGILIKAILDIVTFAGTSLNFIFNYDFDSTLFRKIPVINTIYLILNLSCGNFNIPFSLLRVGDPVRAFLI